MQPDSEAGNTGLCQESSEMIRTDAGLSGGGHYSAECGLRRAGHVSSHNTAHHGFRALRGGDSGAGSNSTHESQIEPCRPLGARSLTVSIEYM